MRRLIVSALRMFKSLWRDTSGIALPLVTIMLVVIIGLSLLAVDGARYVSLQTQMQNAADALALAGARELDKKAGAETRAINAINNLVSNGLSGMGITAPLTVSTLVFYKSLPAASAGWPTNVNLASGDSDATFVAVTVNPVTVPTIFPVTFIGGVANSFSTGARAIAGNAGQQICKVPPVFICNPYETPGMTDAQATAALENAIQPDSVGVRTEFKVLNDGNTGPGHFGWLIPPDGCTGASCLQTWIAENNPQECFSAAGVDLNTGEKDGALPGFNVRFDIGADANDLPDVNVRKGFYPKNSTATCPTVADNPPPVTNSTRAVALTDDTALAPLSTNGGSIGNGQWDCGTYWSFNHQNAPAPTVRADGTSAVCGTPTTTTMSRYDVYTYEINNNLVADWGRGTSANNYAPAPGSGSGENGQPICYGSGTTGRRLTYVAVINCLANASAITGGATAQNVPTADFATFFMMQPIPTSGGPTSQRNLTGEIIGFSDLNGGGTGIKATVFNDVQLYR
jgi:Flp pilus assembly protein TadG